MNKFITLLFLTLSFCSTTLFGQSTYKFIEPNISLSYDSNYFKIGQRYSNTFYETEAYDFSYQGDSTQKVTIHIKAAHPIDFPSKQLRDSLILTGLDKIKNAQNDSFSITNIDTKVRDISNFSCVGIVGYDKVNKEYATVISCYHFSDNDNTEINFISNGKDLDNEYGIVISFLRGFKSYSKQEIENEEQLIKSKYSVSVAPTQTVIDNFKYRPKTYLGIVSTKQPLQHKISEVRLTGSFGQEIFLPDENGKVYIISNDKDKGNISKKGELVIINSFGKKVKLPFTFSYINKGIW
jgi:hypothetical protein